MRNPAVNLADGGLGERHYAIRLKDLPVGQLVQSARKTLEGDYVYSSELAFQLTKGQPVRVSEQKRFSGRPPHPLLMARQTDTTAATTTRVSIRSA